ncbi:MAG: hypothetical protein FVQ84_02880 [Planctomycetes bacterium]|nr:hypothetical protein [Planctomycetota bacterium]
MCQSYPVYNLNVNEKLQIEQMGTKTKFWFVNIKDNIRWLFKYNRQNTGEDWSEKIASEIAELIGLPHAIVELAKCEDQRGVLSKDFTERKTKGNLVHGNELLRVIDSDYPMKQFWKVSQHSVNNIIDVLPRDFVRLPYGYSFPSNIDTALDLFLGYLMFDVLIGNTDRHHENWGVLVRKEDSELHVELSPTFDHASSLGRELEETKRESLLVGNSYKADMSTYAQRASSAIYLNTGDSKPLSTLDAFVEISNYAPHARDIWLDKLRDIAEDSLKECISRVPRSILSDMSEEFAFQLLLFNRNRLLNLIG